MNNSKPNSDDIQEILGLDEHAGGRKLFRFVVAAVIVLGVVVATVWFFAVRGSDAIRYVTVKVTRGDLTVTVTATGTLQPVNQVDVGTEVSGTIKTVAVDYNDRVKVGDELARLDTDKLEAQVAQSRAALESTRAKLIEARATVFESQSNLERFQRVQELSAGQVPSKREMDAAEAALRRARAIEATVTAQIAEAEAKLSMDQTNLRKAVIRSPINGVVLKRQVEPGQTVAASFQTPVLFTLAESLAQMELHVDVDEADIGQVRAGQSANFTVDGYPNRTFAAVISEVRHAPKTVEGVVTYECVLTLDNSGMALRPGMTATAEITVKKLENRTLVPNAALRFSPPVEEEVAGEGGGLVSLLLPRRPRSLTRAPERDATNKNVQRLWVVDKGQAVAVSVTTGATDGTMTEVTGGEIKPGMAVIVDTVTRGP